MLPFLQKLLSVEAAVVWIVVRVVRVVVVLGVLVVQWSDMRRMVH